MSEEGQDRPSYITNRRRAKERLPRLVAWLREVSALVDGAVFNLDCYWDHDPKQPTPRSVKEAKHCGFRGCGLGWASLNPWFRRAGLLPVSDDDGYFKQAIVEAAGFFGIELSAAETIFGTSADDWAIGVGRVTRLLDPHDPAEAAKRVERFCIDNGIKV